MSDARKRKIYDDGRAYWEIDCIPRTVICPECNREVNVKKAKIVNHSVDKSMHSAMCIVGAQKFRAIFHMYPCYQQPTVRLSKSLLKRNAIAPEVQQPKRPKCKCGKAIYTTEYEADLAATTMARVNLRRSRKVGRTATRVYKCDLGNCYHVTSSEYKAFAPA